MYFDGEITVEAITGIDISTTLSVDEIMTIVEECLRS